MPVRIPHKFEGYNVFLGRNHKEKGYNEMEVLYNDYFKTYTEAMNKLIEVVKEFPNYTSAHIYYENGENVIFKIPSVAK